MAMDHRYDFSTPIDRRGLASKKWQQYEQSDVIPMWVADMDIAAPPCVQNALDTVVNRGVLGYGTVTPELNTLFLNWCQDQYGWQPEAEWLIWLPGVVPGIHHAMEAWLKPGDGLAIQTPVYPPIRQLGAVRKRPIQVLGFPDLAPGKAPSLGTETLSEDLNDQTRALVLCNPQNPLGRAYSSEELAEVAEAARQHDALVISDEIWADLILKPGVRHIPFASVNEDAAQRSITLMAASKTFNIAGLTSAVAIVPNPTLRQSLLKQLRGLSPEPSYLGLIATQAAWGQGGPWLSELKGHLNGNLDRVEQWVAEHPGVEWSRPEATFVVWLDVRSLGLDDPTHAFLDAGVALSDGAAFGGPGFVRLNIGCPVAQLEAALQRMSRVCR